MSKGERSIKIRGFSTKKVTETDEETGDETERLLRRFPILSVFDIEQTEPIEGADVSASPVQRLTGDDPTGIYDAMAPHMTAQGWSVVREPIAGETNGYTTIDGTKRIVVDDAIEPAQPPKTMLHEAAHAVLHTDDAGEGDRGSASRTVASWSARPSQWPTCSPPGRPGHLRLQRGLRDDLDQG